MHDTRPLQQPARSKKTSVCIANRWTWWFSCSEQGIDVVTCRVLFLCTEIHGNQLVALPAHSMCI